MQWLGQLEGGQVLRLLQARQSDVKVGKSVDLAVIRDHDESVELGEKGAVMVADPKLLESARQLSSKQN